MSASTTLLTFASLQNDTSATSDLNQNFTAVNTALGNCLALNGQTPNQMQASLDMNSNRILNLPVASSANEPVTLATFQAAQVQTSLTPINNNSVLGNVSGGIALPVSLNSTQLSALVSLSTFTTTTPGSVPAPGSGVTTKYLRSDGTWQFNLNGINLTAEPTTTTDSTLGVTYGTIAVNTLAGTTVGTAFVNINPTASAAQWRGIGYYDANNNYIWGRGAGIALTSGTNNTFIGFQAGRSVTSGVENIILGGNGGGTLLSTGSQNTILGSEAGNAITTDSGHTLIGYQAGLQLQGAVSSNTFVGVIAGQKSVTAQGCVFLGRGAGVNGVNDVNAIAIGHAAFFASGTGTTDIIAIGNSAGGNPVDGSSGISYGPAGSVSWGLGKTGAASSSTDNEIICIGTFSGKGGTVSSNSANTPLNNCIAIGNLASLPLKNSTMVLGNQLTTVNTAGTIWSGGPTASASAYSVDANSTYAAADLVGGIIKRSGLTAGRTDTTDTAVNIVAATNGPGLYNESNVGRMVYINNVSGQIVTVAAGAGVTLSGTVTIAANSVGQFWMICNNCMSGSQAVTFIRVNA